MDWLPLSDRILRVGVLQWGFLVKFPPLGYKKKSLSLNKSRSITSCKKKPKKRCTHHGWTIVGLLPSSETQNKMRNCLRHAVKQ